MNNANQPTYFTQTACLLPLPYPLLLKPSLSCLLPLSPLGLPMLPLQGSFSKKITIHIYHPPPNNAQDIQTNLRLALTYANETDNALLRDYIDKIQVRSSGPVNPHWLFLVAGCTAAHRLLPALSSAVLYYSFSVYCLLLSTVYCLLILFLSTIF